MASDPFADFDHEIRHFLVAAGVEPTMVQLETPAHRDFGERSTNVAMRLAKERRQAPRQIADDILSRFSADSYRFISKVEIAGAGFINFHLNYATWLPHAITSIRAARDEFGRRDNVPAERVVVEHTSVNPNKEWHIGHVRNAVLGDIVTRVLRHGGYDVQVQNYIDDTGLQAAQAILGLTDFPEAPGRDEKFDHYAGRLYVKIAAEFAGEKSLRERLKALEEGAPEEVTEHGIPERQSIQARLANIENLKSRVMQTMRGLEHGEYRQLVDCILQGQLQTAFRLGIFYDLLNWESDLVASHTFQLAIDVLQQSPRVFKAAAGRYAGALVIQTGEATAEKEAKAEVLIRSNGIPTYVGKDIAYHMWKFGVIPERLRRVEYLKQPNDSVLMSTTLQGTHLSELTPDRVINVIAVDQSLAQATVKEALRVSGFPKEADDLFHLAYGLVTTRDGRISGRKGTSVAGDRIIDEAVKVAYDRVRERDEGLPEEQVKETAEAVGVGAVRYFMAQYNPMRNIEFDVSDVVSYDGNTSLYVQYALVRMAAILRRALAEHGISSTEIESANTEVLEHEQEKKLVLHLGLYPATIADACRTLSVNLVAEYAYELAATFSQFYRDCGVLNADPPLRVARLLLVDTVKGVLSNACSLLGVPVIERL